MRRQTVYFEEPGELNTRDALNVALAYADEGRKHFVVATTRGEVGVLLAEAVSGRGVNLVCVTHSYGWREPHVREITRENKARIESLGGRVYGGTVLTNSLETALGHAHRGISPTYIVSETLRLIGLGVKVCAEIVMEACDAGLVPEGEEVVAVGGSGEGADSVCLIRAAASKRFLELRVLEVACKPRCW